MRFQVSEISLCMSAGFRIAASQAKSLFCLRCSIVLASYTVGLENESLKSPCCRAGRGLLLSRKRLMLVQVYCWYSFELSADGFRCERYGGLCSNGACFEPVSSSFPGTAATCTHSAPSEAISGGY
mgnify:CR=1 FL=1